MSVTTSATNVPAIGNAAVPFSISGAHRPTIYLRAVAGAGNDAYTSPVVSVAASATSAGVRVVFNGTGANRTVTLQWATTSQGTWTNVKSITQYGDNRLLPSGEYVAANNAGMDLTWAEAMGIETKYNSQDFRVNNETRYTTTKATGCGGYSETNYPQGRWNLPTRADARALYQRGYGTWPADTGTIMGHIQWTRWETNNTDTNNARTLIAWYYGKTLSTDYPSFSKKRGDGGKWDYNGDYVRTTCRCTAIPTGLVR